MFELENSIKMALVNKLHCILSSIEIFNVYAIGGTHSFQMTEPEDSQLVAYTHPIIIGIEYGKFFLKFLHHLTLKNQLFLLMFNLLNCCDTNIYEI